MTTKQNLGRFRVTAVLNLIRISLLKNKVKVINVRHQPEMD